MNRRQCLAFLATAPLVPPLQAKDEVDYWIQRLDELGPNHTGPIPFHIPERLLNEINTRGPHCIIIN